MERNDEEIREEVEKEREDRHKGDRWKKNDDERLGKGKRKDGHNGGDQTRKTD